MNSTKLKTVLVLSILLLSGFVGFIPTSHAKADSFGLRFMLQVVPGVVPADGGSYGLYVFLQDVNGQPAAAPSDITVSLFSSDQRAGTVQTSVIIPRDTSYTFSSFLSTTTPGSTVLTAVASGISAGIVTVNTQVPVGYPSTIAIFSLPSALIPGGGETGKLVVQLQDPTGAPARAPSDIVVALSSSNPNVVSVQPTVLVPFGSTFGVAIYTPTNLPGGAIISAGAPGFLSGATSVGVSGPSPSSIQVSLLPRVIPADTAATGHVAVSLLDPNGFPARANASLTVVLTSSNTSVAFFSDPFLIINAGSYYGFKTILSGGAPGVTEITAQASGLSSGIALLPGRVYGTPSDGETIELQTGPRSALPDGGTYSNVVCAQLLNQTDGFPVQGNASNPTIIYFSSSKALIGSITGSTTVTAGQTFGLASYTSTLLVGSTTITAAANGFAHDEIDIANSAPPPAQIAIGLASESVRATGEAYPLLFVQLQDNSGNPAKAPQDTQIFLSSNVTGATDRFVTVPAGSSYTITNFYSSASPFTANITASGTGFSPIWMLASTLEPFPSSLALSTSLLPMISDGTNHQVFVQLMDTQGRPAKPERPVSIFLTTDNPSVATVIPSVTLNAGSSYAPAALTILQPGVTTVTAIAQGYASGQTQVTVGLLPTTLALSYNLSSVVVGNTYPVGVLVTSEAANVYGAVVSASALTGKFSLGSVVTNLQGVANFTYIPQYPGSDTIRFTVSLAGFNSSSAAVTFKVDAYYTVTTTLTDESSVGLSGMTVTLVDAKGSRFNDTSASDGTVTFNNVFWGNATMTVPALLQTSGAKYTLTSFNGVNNTSSIVSVLSNLQVTAKYQTWYQVTVISAYGTSTGTGQYLKGSRVTVSVSPTTLPSGFMSSKKFSGWTGGVTNSNATVSFTLTKATVATAQWTDDLTALYILVAVIAAVVAAAVGLFWFIRKRRMSSTEPTKEEEFK
jgi:hypothetical protein